MNGTPMEKEFDAIVIGSGTCGATIARELSKKKKKVLILERGNDVTLKENLLGIASIADEVAVGNNMKAMRAITTGGSTSLYFGVASLPPLDPFRSLGIDLSEELEEVQQELPIAKLPDDLLSTQSIRLRESAMALGYAWKKNLMMIDQSKCTAGYCYDAKWKAKSYVQEAVKEGAKLINRATVRKVLTNQNKAVGVEYTLQKTLKRTETCQAYGTKIIIAAGSLASSKILRDTGIRNIANRGFYCDPAFAMFGTVPGLKGNDGFLGSMSTEYEDDISLGDGNMARALYQMLMLSNLNFRLLFSFPSTIGIGVKLKDALGGQLQENHRYSKQLSPEELKKLKKGEDDATRILKNAGAKYIFKGRLVGGNPGGVISIKEQLNETLETEYRNLHVCDASVLPENVRITPALTLICLSKYLAKKLLSSM
jgi:hypothetical protein